MISLYNIFILCNCLFYYISLLYIIYLSVFNIYYLSAIYLLLLTYTICLQYAYTLLVYTICLQYAYCFSHIPSICNMLTAFNIYYLFANSFTPSSCPYTAYPANPCFSILSRNLPNFLGLANNVTL